MRALHRIDVPVIMDTASATTQWVIMAVAKQGYEPYVFVNQQMQRFCPTLEQEMKTVFFVPSDASMDEIRLSLEIKI